MRIFQLHSAALAICLLAFACFFSNSFVPTSFAQGIITGGITGTVTDQSGAVIPGASVQAKNDATGAVLQSKSDAQGAFSILSVPIGTYSLTVAANGFGPAALNHVHVVAGNATPVGKVTLSLGKAAVTVEVEGTASQLINTESAQGETVVDTQQLATLPVSGAIDNVTLMVPGVVMTHNDAFSNTNGVNFSVNGERGRSNNSEIDGQSNNDDSIGGPSFFFSNQDAVQEVQVITTDMGAQYGRNFGSVVNYITKSGSNTFHGSGFEYYLGSWGSSLLQTQKDPQFGFCPSGSNAAYANTNGCSLITVPRFVENLYGGTLGGPIIKNKLFFFGSTFWAHEYQSGAIDTTGGSIFPDPTGLKQLQSAFPNNPGVAAMVMNGPYSISDGHPGPVAGTTTTVPVTDGSNTSNIEMAGVQRTLASHVLDQEELGRLDYQMTPKDRFYLRYDYQNNPWIPAWYLYSNAGIAEGGYSQVSGITHEVGGSWYHTFTPSITDQLRYSFQQSSIGFEQGALPDCTISNFSPCSSNVSLGSTEAGFGYGSGSIIGANALPQGRFVKVNQVQDNAQWIHGRHTILFGGEYDFQNSPNGYLPNATGSFNFAPGDAGSLRSPGGGTLSSSSPLYNGFSAMLEGVGTLGLAAGSPTVPFREPDFAFYFQDDFKAMPNMTLDLGLRYEYFSPSVNLIHNESVAQQTGPNPFWDTSLPLSATTFPAVNSSFRNVEPRIGIAYTPGNLQKMVVHAGFAINVDPVFYNIFLNIATAAPTINSGVITCDGVTVVCEPANGFTYGTVQAADKQYIPTGGDPRLNPITTVPSNLRNPMAETYTLGVQYQVAPAAVAEVRYVGNHTFDNFQSLNTNPDILDVRSAFPAYGSGISACSNPAANGYTRPDCNYNAVNTVANTAFSIYNALEATFTVRDFHHWTGTASYTFSRTIDNVSEIFGTASGGTTNAYAQDPLNSDVGERGVSGNSYPSLWGIQMAYTEPWFNNQNGIIGRLLGGYYLNTFYQYNGGQPYSPFQNAVVQSPNVTPSGSTPAAEVMTNFCDFTFAQDFDFGGFDSQCRPILANPRAPMTSVGINTGNGNYVNYVTGAPGARSSFHWLWNNQAEAIALGNPFPGVGRNTLRGDSWNNLDASIGKNFKTTERVTVQISMNVFNVFNRAYYGTPDNNVEDSLISNFLQNTFAGGTSDTAAGGGAYYAGFGNRNIQLNAHINF